ncbi:DMT family transporter [Ferrimonas senticii]|uniref:DMT family transporter n=1 Tax=Ferrimonas senticii TaxID=394566 RepID=UPI000425337E|nr:DMT family transporter [Ferrimonas senticii]
MSLTALKNHCQRLSPLQLGVILALGSNLLFVLEGALVKQLAAQLSLLQILLCRQLVFLLLLLPLIRRFGQDLWRPKSLPLHGLRIITALMSLYFGFIAFSNLPLADATALGFTGVLFVALIAKLWLNESISRQRVLTIAVGFIGVMLITQPTFALTDSLYIGAGLLAALGGAGAASCVRHLSQVHSKTTLMTYQAAAVGLLVLPFALSQWQTPTIHELLGLGLIGLVSALATGLGVSAYQKAPANVVSNVGYSKMLFAIGLGYGLFHELPNCVGVLGIAVLMLSALLPLWRSKR